MTSEKTMFSFRFFVGDWMKVLAFSCEAAAHRKRDTELKIFKGRKYLIQKIRETKNKIILVILQNRERGVIMKNPKKRMYKQPRLLALLCTLAMLVTGVSPMNLMASAMPLAVCKHPNVQTTTKTEREYSHDGNSYCYANVEYIYYQCKDCNVRWSSKNNISTESHTWSVSSSSRTPNFLHTTNGNCYEMIETITYKCNTCNITKTETNVVGKSSHSWTKISRSPKTVYSHQIDSYCYKNLEEIEYRCIKCGDAKIESIEKSSSAHSWREMVDHYDGTYSHLRTECLICFLVKSTRKVKGYVQVGLRIIEKEEVK